MWVTPAAVADLRVDLGDALVAKIEIRGLETTARPPACHGSAGRVEQHEYDEGKHAPFQAAVTRTSRTEALGSRTRNVKDSVM